MHIWLNWLVVFVHRLLYILIKLFTNPFFFSLFTSPNLRVRAFQGMCNLNKLIRIVTLSVISSCLCTNSALIQWLDWAFKGCGDTCALHEVWLWSYSPALCGWNTPGRGICWTLFVVHWRQAGCFIEHSGHSTMPYRFFSMGPAFTKKTRGSYCLSLRISYWKFSTIPQEKYSVWKTYFLKIC